MKNIHVNLPAQCSDMNAARTEIGNIDHLVIKLLSTRFEYVKTASKFKKKTTDVQVKK